SFDHGNPTRSFPRQLPPRQLLLVIMDALEPELEELEEAELEE
ncbi:hypothetical protein Tco_0480408, partial [Tanacetum coccineum]